jgi:hypothetical protein
MNSESKILEKEDKANRDAERILKIARYRVGIKRKLRERGIPSALIRNASTAYLEILCRIMGIKLISYKNEKNNTK